VLVNSIVVVVVVVVVVVAVVVVFIRGSVSLRPIAGKGPIFLKYMCESIIGFLMPTQGKCHLSCRTPIH
jgi:hypothetical protein